MLQQNKFSMQEGTDQPLYFCYLAIKTDLQQWTGFAFILLGALVVIKAAYQYRKAINISMINLTVKMIYIAIFIWATLFLAKIVISQILYVQETMTEQSQDEYLFLSHFSKYIFIIDSSSVFFLQTVLVLICFNWVNDIVKQLLVLQQLEPQLDTDRSYLSNQKLFNKVLRLYLFARTLFFLIIVPFIIASEPQTEANIVKITLILLIIETLLVLVALVLGIVLIKKNKKLNEFVNEREIDVMINRYVILIICTTIRLVLDTIFVSFNFSKLLDSKKCYINSMKQQQKARIAVDFILSNLVAHCLLIYIVLRIYNIRELDLDSSQSLIINEPFNRFIQKEEQPNEGQVDS